MAASKKSPKKSPARKGSAKKTSTTAGAPQKSPTGAKSTKTATKKTAVTKKKAVSKKAPKPTPQPSEPAATESEPTLDAGADTPETDPALEAAADPPAEPDAETQTKSEGKSNSATEIAQRVLAGEADMSVADLGDQLTSDKKSVAAQAARVLDEILQQKPEAVVPLIDRFARVIGSPARRPAQSAANALPIMARVAPARVARHLPRLKESYDQATLIGKDGLVRTFAGLCTASVAYQKRLEPELNKALEEADAKTLLKWSQIVLPALKGEPHARARATVEGRLGRIPKAVAQKIADFLGIKLRLRYR